MWLSRHANQLIQRATCHFKPHSYFLYTSAPLPSILLLIPARAHRLQSHLRRLGNQQDFLLADQIKNVKGDGLSEIKTSNNGAQTKFESIYGIAFNETTSFICSTPQGTLQITKSPSNSKAVVAVILFSAIQGEKIRYISSQNYQNIIIFFKISAIYCLYRVYIQLKFSTRLEGHTSTV